MTKDKAIELITEYKRKALDGIIADSKSLGVYDAAYSAGYDFLADMVAQYNLANDNFIKSGCKASRKTKNGGEGKTPELLMIEALRKDIGTWMDRLMLSPKTQSKGEKKEGSILEQTLAAIGKL